MFVPPLIPSFSGQVGRFFSAREPEGEQARGLYVPAGLYYLIGTYLYVITVSAVLRGENDNCFSDSQGAGMIIVSAMENSRMHRFLWKTPARRVRGALRPQEPRMRGRVLRGHHEAERSSRALSRRGGPIR